MAKASVQRSARVASRPKTAIIDCDIHNIINGLPDLFPYLSARWRRHAETIGMRGPAALAEGLTYPGTARLPPAPIPGRSAGVRVPASS